MSFDIQHDYELRIFHSERIFAHDSPDECTAWIVETTPGADSCKATSSFDTILDNLEHKLGLSDASLIKLMDDYMQFGCSTLKLRTTPEKLQGAGLLVIH